MREFSNVVFAGGGSRCFWQAGFWSVFDPDGKRVPQRVAAVSAGAAMACLLFSRKTAFGLSYFKQATASNRRNFYPTRVLRGGKPFPHERIYRDAIEATIDVDALATLHAGPEFHIAMSALPRWLGPHAAMVTGMLAYDLEKRVRRPVHPTLGRALGFRPVFGSVRACATPGALADLILASSATPPFTPVGRFDGHAVLDGGLVDNVPVQPLADQPGETLVLLSRCYPRLPNIARRTYVQPSKPVRISMWEYTDPQGLQDTFDLGRADAEAFMRSADRNSGAAA